MNDNPQVRVGVGVVVFKNNKILLGKRKSKLGEGEYAGLGGHLEFGESIEDCAKRECREEAGIGIKNMENITWIWGLWQNGKKVNLS